MNEKNTDEEPLDKNIEYLPNRQTGLCLFNEEPQNIRQEVLDLIGIDGVEYIHRTLTRRIEANKKFHGNGDIKFFGLFYFQRFIDIKSLTVIEVFQMIDNPNEQDKVPYDIRIGEDSFHSKNPTRSNDQIIKEIKSGFYSYYYPRTGWSRDY